MALLVLTGAIYWPGLSGDLVLDDTATLEPITRLARGELIWHEALTRHDNFRPLSMASYVVNWLTTGDRVWPLKLTNLVIHLIGGVLVFVLADALLARPVAGIDRGRCWVALWIAACWLLAPLLVSTVLYVTQRMAALAAVFSLAALLAYVRGRERIAAGRAGGPGLIVLALALLWPLAVMSKENGVLVPILAIVVELFFFGGARALAAHRPAHGHGRLRNLLHRPIALCMIAGVLIGTVMIVAAPSAIFLSYEYRPFTPSERLLTEWRILFDYLANLILLPGGSPFGIYHDEYPVSRGLLEPVTTLIAGAAWLAVLAAGWWTRGTRTGLLIFGAWFFLAAHLVESTLLPLELYFEHRNYLPSFGVFFSLGFGAYLLVSRVRLRRLVVAALVLVPVGYAAVTYHRVLVWQSWERMLLAAANHYPDSIRVRTGLANLHVGRGDLEGALAHLEHAAARPGSAEAGIAIHVLNAHCLADRPPPPGAYRGLRGARPSDDFYTVNTLAWLSESVDRGECRVLDVARIAGALHDAINDVAGRGAHGQAWLLHMHTARLLAAAGRKREALAHLDRAASLEQEQLEAGLLAVRYRLELEELDAARHTLRLLKKRDRGRIASHTRLIEAFERRLEGVEARERSGG